MGTYRLEHSKSNRAGCQNAECKKKGAKIQKGELRFGTLVEINGTQSWQWRHWGCVTPKVIGNLKETVEDNLDYLDGYEEIDEKSQGKARQALADGHVADEDWLGDVEMNRPGMRGFRSPAAKKQKKDSEKAEIEAESESPRKAPPKKRSRVEKEEENDHNEASEKKPAKKKSKTKAMENSSLEAEALEIEKAKPKSRKTAVKKEPKESPVKEKANEVKAASDTTEVAPKLKRGKKRDQDHVSKSALENKIPPKESAIMVEEPKVSNRRTRSQKA